MKQKHLPLMLLGVSLVSCGDYQQPSSGDFDPLRRPGVRKPTVEIVNSLYQPGQFVIAAADGTGLFNNRPTGNAEAETILNSGTNMRVISSDGTFLKVELDDGKVGFVASVMVIDSQQAATLPTTPAPINGDLQTPPNSETPLQPNISTSPIVPTPPTKVSPEPLPVPAAKQNP
jgi:hypothetical protein